MCPTLCRCRAADRGHQGLYTLHSENSSVVIVFLSYTKHLFSVSFSSLKENKSLKLPQSHFWFCTLIIWNPHWAVQIFKLIVKKIMFQQVCPALHRVHLCLCLYVHSVDQVVHGDCAATLIHDSQLSGNFSHLSQYQWGQSCVAIETLIPLS